MSKRRVGGSGWAGVYGSFVGLAKGKAGSRLSFRSKRASKAKALKNNIKSKPSSVAIDLNNLPDDDGVRTAAKRAKLIQADLEMAKARVALLESQFALAMDKFGIAQDAAKKVRPIPKIVLTPKAAKPK